ncbi:MAG: transglycosylase SLT domain-containing protein [Gammaproteobacteria bacterium]|nr:transglycosylase SLT domain-containing protein [Gammaproteobacteria bacterium]
MNLLKIESVELNHAPKQHRLAPFLGGNLLQFWQLIRIVASNVETENHQPPLGQQGHMDRSHNPLFLLLFALLLSTLQGCVQHASKSSQLQASTSRNLTLPPAERSQQNHLLTTQNNPHDLWQRIREGFQLPTAHQQQFRPQMRHFLSLDNFFVNVSQRAEPFLYFIVDSLEKRGLPTELALIPVIESAFKPLAHSSSKAAGIWQFIPSTGRLYDLKQNHWYDGRRDIYASTLAAINLLDDLGKQFNGDWLLAIAAYNGGPTMVLKAMAKNRRLGKPTDFWHLELRSETQRYVPKLLAIREIILNPKRYRINLPLIPNHPQLAKVNLSAQISLKTAATLAELSTAETTRLNPGFKRGITSPHVQYLLLPMEQAKIFSFNLKKIQRKRLKKTEPNREKSRQNHYRVQQADTLWSIAYRFGTTAPQLALWNQIGLQYKIRVGQHLRIASGREKTTEVAFKTRHPLHHRVKKNESLFLIARRFELNIADLRRWNRIDYGQQPNVGQLLRLTPERKVRLNAS